VTNPIPPSTVNGYLGLGGRGGAPNGSNGYQASICPGIETQYVACGLECDVAVFNPLGGLTLSVSSPGQVEGMILDESLETTILPKVTRESDPMAAQREVIRMRFDRIPAGPVRLRVRSRAARIDYVYIQIDPLDSNDSRLPSSEATLDIQSLIRGIRSR
jgi:hypothetical protein